MIAGLDIGTTGCKVVVFDLKGNEIYRSYRSYETKRCDGHKEIDVNVLTTSIKEVIKDTATKYEITALGVDSFGEAIVLLDKNDTPLTNIIEGTDIRGSDELDELINVLGKNKIANITGQNPDFTFSIFKAMWLKKHHPEIMNKTKRILLIEDFVIYLLTGNAIIDYSLATRTCAFDLNTNSWSKEIMDAAGFDDKKWSKPVPLLFNAGNIKEEIKKELNIKNDITITPAGHDQIAVALGCGVLSPNKAVDGSGTVECITCIYDKPKLYDGMVENYLGIAPFLDKCATYAYNFCGCSLVDWFRNNFVKNTDEKQVYSYLENEFIDKPTGILLLPHFAGAAVPYMDSNSKGMIWGLTLEHSLSNIYQAVLEGIAYEMKMHINILKKNEIKPKKLIATGGGASSTKWLQIKADVLNMPIYRIKGKEVGCKGGAILAGVVSGIFNNIEEAINQMVEYVDVIKPRKENVYLYQKEFKRYQKLYKFGKELNNIK